MFWILFLTFILVLYNLASEYGYKNSNFPFPFHLFKYTMCVYAQTPWGFEWNRDLLQNYINITFAIILIVNYSIRSTTNYKLTNYKFVLNFLLAC